MRFILFCIMTFIPTLAFSAIITCYSSGKKIYESYTQDVYYQDGMFIFYEPRSRKDVYIFADCVIKI